MFINYFFLWILSPIRIQSIDRIWLLRHCDKPVDPYNPCCSELGYKRAENWHRYFEKYTNLKNDNNRIQLYSSNYNEKKVCLSELTDYQPNKYCQKSQRMFLTAYYLQQRLYLLTKYSILDKINTNYCVGDKNELVKHVLSKDYISDAIIIWEHQEMVKMINLFGISITKWKHKLRNEYNIIFLIDVKTKQLYYDCFDFVSNVTECSSSVDKWLDGFPRINKVYTYHNPIYLYQSNQVVTQNIYLRTLEIIFIICLFIYGFTWLVSLYERYKRRGEYIIII
jgi:hypothetical protein